MLEDICNRLYAALYTAQPEEGSRLYSYVYASDVSKCIRQQFYKMTDTQVDEDAKDNDNVSSFVFDAGNAFEAFMTNRMIMAKIYDGKRRVAHPELLISGETDPIVVFEGKKIITEIKATHRKHYMTIINNYKSGTYPQTYYDQLQVYLHLYPQADFGVLIICNRDVNYNDNVPPFIILPVERDENWKKTNWERLSKLKEALKNNVPPDREFTLNDWQCKVCPYANTCWTSTDDE